MGTTPEGATETSVQHVAGITRLSVNLNPEAAAVLKKYTEKRHISYTEAIRRAISILKFVDDEVSAGRELQVADGEAVRKVVLIS